jgi:hypothetical protein
MKEGETKPPNIFDEINSYLKKEAPEGVENPTVQGLARQLGITDDVLDHWIAKDRQFRNEMTNLKEFQTKDPFNEGNSTDYFVHSSGILFILDEMKKRYSV